MWPQPSRHPASRPLGVLVAVLFGVGSEGLATALISEGPPQFRVHRPRTVADFFFPVGLEGSQQRRFPTGVGWFGFRVLQASFDIRQIRSKLCEWQSLHSGFQTFVALPANTFEHTTRTSAWRLPRNVLENVFLSKKIPTLFEASLRHSYGQSSRTIFILRFCLFGAVRGWWRQTRLAGAHVGDLFLHDRPCSKDHHHAHGFLSKPEEMQLTFELPLSFYKLVEPRGGKAPPVIAEYMSTTSLSICPAIAAQLLPRLRQVFFHDVPKDSIVKHVVDFVFLYHG